MPGLIPLMLNPVASGNRSSVIYTPSKQHQQHQQHQQQRHARSQSANGPSKPVHAPSPSPANSSLRRASFPVVFAPKPIKPAKPTKPAKRAPAAAPAPIPVMPYTSDDWRRAVSEAKRQNINRQYRACFTRCTEILNYAKNLDVEPVYLISLHFYAATAMEMCARPLTAPSSYRDWLLQEARSHYDQASELVQTAEVSALTKHRMSFILSPTLGPHSESMSMSMNSRLWSSFGSLTNLHSLDLSGCEKLERLPDSFGSLPSLEYFNAFSCANLTISSETFGNIRTLEHINLSWCEKVEVWPTQVAHQRSLKILQLTGTYLQNELASVIELPSDLEVLWIANPWLDTVMPSLGHLLKLKDLHLEYRREVKCLPASLERPSQLTWLTVAACPIIHTSEVLSDEVVYPNLSDFILEECINVVEVGTLPKALEYVRLDRCYNLRSIQGLCGLPMLYWLDIRKCNELQELPSVKTLVSLRYLFVADCEKLKNIRDLAHLTKLRSLRVRGCPELEKLEGVEYCTSLWDFAVKGCP